MREAVLAAGAAASLAALLFWLGPPGNDLAAHVYQRTVFVSDGFQLWNNFWYGGRYSFVTYSVLYYPLAALFGIKALAILSIGIAALAFAVVVCRQWGPMARWSSRTFAVVWAGLVISAAFPFALGIAFGLLAIWALQTGKRWQFGVLAVLTVAASPLAFLLLTIFLVGIGLGMRERGRRLLAPTLIVAGVGLCQFLVTRAFADGGRYPFSMFELVSIMIFCTVGGLLTWRVDHARTIRWFFVAYAVASLVAFSVTSPLGENIARIRFASLPIAVLILSLRAWKPLPVAALVLVLAASWNLSPHAWSFSRSANQHAASQPEFWQPAVNYLSRHLTPSYRVESVDTAGHWAAVYLPRAGIPLTRGWYRQDDFPQNEVLYDQLDGPTYLGWLRSLGVRYVVLTDAPTDYSSKQEALLIRSGSLRAEAGLPWRAHDDLLRAEAAADDHRDGEGGDGRARADAHDRQPRITGELPHRCPLLAVLDGRRRQHRLRDQGRRRDDSPRVAAPGPRHAAVQGQGPPRAQCDGRQPPGLRRAV